MGLTFVATLLSARSESGVGWVAYPGGPGPGAGKHVVLLAGDEEYRSEEALPMLAKILSHHHGFKCTVLFATDADGTINPNQGESLGRPEALDSADAIVTLLRFRKWPDATMQHFDDAMRRGVPIVALRTSTHSFQLPAASGYPQYNKFGKAVLGEGWVNHWGRHQEEATRGVIEPAAANNPLLRGVAEVFVDTDVYEVYPPADATVLLRGQVLTGMAALDPPAVYPKQRFSDRQTQDINTPMMPVAWSRDLKLASGKTQRILCTTMGAATDLTNEGLRRLVVNGVFRGLGLEVPPSAEVTPVGDYHPSNYGFDGFAKSVTAAAYECGK